MVEFSSLGEVSTVAITNKICYLADGRHAPEYPQVAKWQQHSEQCGTGAGGLSFFCQFLNEYSLIVVQTALMDFRYQGQTTV